LNLRAAISKIAEISLTPLPPDINSSPICQKTFVKQKSSNLSKRAFVIFFI
jgi:hypothetical protein